MRLPNLSKGELLDLGILPDNCPHITPEEIKRWMDGMRRQADKAREIAFKKHQTLLSSLGYTPAHVHADMWDASVAFAEMAGRMSGDLFGIVPDVSRFIDTLWADPIGFSSTNQEPGKNWETAEYFLVAKTRSIANFGWLEGPYNVEVGKGVEREPGCVRKVWAFDLKGLWDADYIYHTKPTDAEISEHIWRLFLKGRMQRQAAFKKRHADLLDASDAFSEWRAK